MTSKELEKEIIDRQLKIKALTEEIDQFRQSLDTAQKLEEQAAKIAAEEARAAARIARIDELKVIVASDLGVGRQRQRHDKIIALKELCSLGVISQEQLKIEIERVISSK